MSNFTRKNNIENSKAENGKGFSKVSIAWVSQFKKDNPKSVEKSTIIKKLLLHI